MILTQDPRLQRKSQPASCLYLFGGGVSSMSPYPPWVESHPAYSLSTSIKLMPKHFLLRSVLEFQSNDFFFPFSSTIQSLFPYLLTLLYTSEILRLTSIRFKSWTGPIQISHLPLSLTKKHVCCCCCCSSSKGKHCKVSISQQSSETLESLRVFQN